MYTHIALFCPPVWPQHINKRGEASSIILLQITLHHTFLFDKFTNKDWCSATVSNLKFPLSSFPFVYLTTHQVPCQMFLRCTPPLESHILNVVFKKSYVDANICKYLCSALVFVSTVLSSPWQASMVLFVIISFFLSKGTVPLKTGASRPLRASGKGIGTGVNEPFIYHYYFTHLLLYGPRDPPDTSSLR